MTSSNHVHYEHNLFADTSMKLMCAAPQLQVVFRPLKMQQYSDHIEIFVNDASFMVLVEAYTPATHIEVQPNLDFGFVPTKETVQLSLPVRNAGDVKVRQICLLLTGSAPSHAICHHCTALF